MPWTVADVDRHKQGLSPKAKRQWVSVANSALSQCLKNGGSTKLCDARAVRIANGVVEMGYKDDRAQAIKELMIADNNLTLEEAELIADTREEEKNRESGPIIFDRGAVSR
jgi:hypothetical protein